VAAWKLKTEALVQAPGLVPHTLRIERTASACQALLTDLLATLDGGASAQRVRAIRLDALVAEVLTMVEPSLERQGVRLRQAITACPRRVRADGRAIQGVLLNLITNAWEAMGTGGELAVTVVPDTPRWVAVTVQDTGSGMAPEALARLGCLGYSTKPRGLGIGLWLAHRTLRAHGGALTIHSRRGGGTRCVIRLPALTAPTVAPGRQPKPDPLRREAHDQHGH